MEVDEVVIKPCIDDTSDINVDSDVDAEDSVDEDAKPSSKEEMQDSLEDISHDAVFERDDWKDKVATFAKEYPMSVELFEEIGDCILEDEHLWKDEGCLEKALLNVLCNKYTPDEDKANDEEFLAKYIYNNEAIKGKIVDEYMESLEKGKLPSTMNRGGKISLTAAKMPRTIKEAGYLAEKIMRR